MKICAPVSHPTSGAQHVNLIALTPASRQAITHCEIHAQDAEWKQAMYLSCEEEVVQTLKEAVAETNQLLARVEAAEVGTATTALSISRNAIDRNTVERYHSLQMMLNNCLAADARLRRWAKQQHQIHQTLEQDLSRRAGNRALTDAYTEVMKQYAHCLKD